MLISIDIQKPEDILAAQKLLDALSTRTVPSVVLKGKVKRKKRRSRRGHREADVAKRVETLKAKIVKLVAKGMHSTTDVRATIGAPYDYVYRLAIADLLREKQLYRHGRKSGARYTVKGQELPEDKRINARHVFRYDGNLEAAIVECISAGVNRAQTIRARLKADYRVWRSTIDKMLESGTIRRVGWASGANYYLP
jgi:hypothetical protein